MNLSYKTGEKVLNLSGPSESDFSAGENVCLADVYDDPCSKAAWYGSGYTTIDYQSSLAFADVELAVTNMVEREVRNSLPTRNLSGFALDRYHEYVSVDEHLAKIDRKIKRLYQNDITFDDALLKNLIEDQIGCKLSYLPEGETDPHWIIIRVITPGATSFNPPHKDIYEGYDLKGRCPKMVNTWLPVAGVNQNAGLALVPGSHRLSESEIIRTKAGAVVNGNKFSVNCIKSWGGHTDLEVVAPSTGEMLVFSSHLIHGIGVNHNARSTRVALEFRLHRVIG